MEYLEILKSGVESWNLWRTSNQNIIPNLTGAYLTQLNLAGVNFAGADLTGANLTSTKLIGADLSNAKLVNANLTDANLTNANLSWADLGLCNFTYTKFSNTDLSNCRLYSTVFGCTNLSKCRGLESVLSQGFCIIDFYTLQKSKKLPKEFLTKLGIPDLLMEYLPDFYNSTLMLYPAFLSHSWEDKIFVNQLYEALTEKGVTVWLDEKKLKIGDNMHDSIAEGIKHYDKLILVCSENSLKSWWVEKELERVYEKERQLQKQYGKKYRLVIPIRLDEEIFNSEGNVFDTLRNSMIGDFTEWKNENKFEKALKELVEALNANKPDIKPKSFL